MRSPYLSLLLLLAACDGGPPPHDAEPPPDTDTPEDTDTDTADVPQPDVSGLAIQLLSPAADAPVDECAETCFSAAVTHDGLPLSGAIVDIWVGDDCIGADLVSDADGRVETCAAALSVGTSEVVATVESGALRAEADSTLEVRPFGWADGFERDTTPVTAVPWTPTFTRYEGNPVLGPGPEGAFDSVGTMVPSVARDGSGWVMWYAGTPEVDYLIGWATSPDGYDWTRGGTESALPPDGVEGSWKRYSTNSPMVLEEDGTWYVYYTGRAGETGDLRIGLATGADPTAVVDVPDNPVFSWSDDEQSWAGEAAAHPAVLRNPNGWWELWYSTGYHKVGYAYSADGESWSRYCNNPVLVGDAANAWESNQVKATEVVIHDGWYLMTYTGGDTGAFNVGWAMSRDGLNWVRAAEPVLTPPDEAGTWESSSVLSAALVVDGSQLRMWYAGTGQDGSAIGTATADLPADISEAR